MCCSGFINSRRLLLTIICVLHGVLLASGQERNMLFHDVTVKNGLNDGYVMSVAQDKYGYIWIGTLGGLNRYNGSSTERFTHQFGDSSSAPGTIPYCITSDADGRLWIGGDDGLYEFDFASNKFKKHRSFPSTFVGKIIAAPHQQLFVFGNGSLYSYNTKSGLTEDLRKKIILPASYPMYSVCLYQSALYIGSTGGYIAYNPETGTATFHSVPLLRNLEINRIRADERGGLWMVNNAQFKLLRLTPGKDSVMVSDDPQLQQLNKKTLYNDFAADGDDMWISTSGAGLLRYNIAARHLQLYLGQYINGVYTSNGFLSCVLKDADKNIWVGKNGGCTYFRPGQNLFNAVYSFPQAEKNQFARAMREDANGNWWFGTVYGVSFCNVQRQAYTFWRNEPGKTNMIYNNSVRGIELDSKGRVWIASGGGINCYEPGTGKMHFFDEHDGVPKAFYYSANRDSKGRIWFGTNRNDGLYYFNENDSKFYSIAQHVLLKKYAGLPVRIVFEDSRQRLWIGTGNGLVMADEKSNTVRYWRNNDSSRNTIPGNTVVDIKEDHKGVIWLSTFNGITGIDTDKEQYTWINESSGLKTNVTSSLVVDDANRLWIGTASGLYMLDSARRQLVSYDETAGMSSAEFTEHPGVRLRNGTIAMPSINGFVTFDAASFKSSAVQLPFYIARGETASRKIIIPRDSGTAVTLSASENSFTIWLEAINFTNPSQTWYAYQLEGFEKDWHYTNDPRIVYTNIPGGHYTLKYKAALKNDFDGIPAKPLLITIENHYYKTTLFWVLVCSLVLSGLYWLYRFRMNQQKQILQLERKAENLEREKTQVQYDSLKQQLNPHFLFNSLTSLRSLIKSDAKTATGFLDGLSMVYRYVLKSGTQELVTLQAELDFVKTFTDLQKIRFGDGLVVQTDIAAESLHKYIAPVTLQNLVENAVKHNTTDAESPLVIEIFTKNNFVVVRNNLQRYHMVETSNKRGLASLHTLYRYYSDVAITVEEDEKYFTVSIPLL